MNLVVLVSLLFFLVADVSHGYKILGLFPFSGRSHYLYISSIMQEMARRGHEVTAVVSYEEKNPPENYTQLVVDRELIWNYPCDQNPILMLEKGSFEDMMHFVWDGTMFVTEVAFESKNLQKFIREDQTKYDLIFIEYFYQPVLFMFAHKYKAPVVAMSTFGYMEDAARIMGNPIYLNYMMHEFRKFEWPLSFKNRIISLYTGAFNYLYTRFHLIPMHQRLAEKHFGFLGPLPDLEDLMKNTSVMFYNSHFSTDLTIPLVPGVVEIGGAHIRKPKPLSPELQKYLDDAKDGAIFFALGSNMQSKDMSPEKLNIFLKAFSKIKQRVLWKFEDENTVMPENVKIGKWFPQNDILAHKNVKLFITHGGLLSTQEAVYNGVPVIGIPFYGDQHLNTKKLEASGLGLRLIYKELTGEDFERALDRILNEPHFQERAQSYSKAFRDRPLSAIDTAAFWMEYVVRQKGAQFMKSPLTNMSIIETFFLDIIGVFILTIVIVVYALKRLCKLVFRKEKLKTS